ncbi:MAG: NAD-dependent epimerase/dehydratase family protein, partial [Candidatus Bathyarchaeota archaeon]
NLKGAILRFANIVGLRATHGIIIDFIRKLRKNKEELEILGDGTQTKSYLHIKDLIKAINLVMKDFNSREDINVYNIGSADQITVNRIAEVICEEMKLEQPPFRYKDSLGNGRGWRGDVKVMKLAIERITNLGWRPTLNSEGAIRQSCRELLETI